MPKTKFVDPIALKKIAKIKELLSKKEMNIRQISEHLFTCYRSAGTYIKFMHDNKLIYISSYKEMKLNKYNRNIAFYSYGSKQDVKKPKPKTPAQKSKMYRKKILNDPELYEFLSARRRALRRKPKPDWTSSWIQR